MTASTREILVGSDQFEVITEDLILRARLDCAIAVCVFDTVDEAGALLHLRCVARQGANPDATDTTLATELLLLDRCVQTLRAAAPQARALKARILVHMPAGSMARTACDSTLTLVGHFMQDIGAELAPVDLDSGEPREVVFRPCMGLLQVR
jgi:chemotaxis receptor (MCP) glutamine deamidase CheD